MPMLHAIQAAFGYVPQASVPVVAEMLNLSRAEVHGLISFYHDFRHQPAGRHVVKTLPRRGVPEHGGGPCRRLCQGAAGDIVHETTPDGAVTLEPIFCIGLCAAAPCGMVDERSLARLDCRPDRWCAEECGR